MEVRYSRDPQSFERMNTSEIRDEFLIADLFTSGEIKLVYLHVDRMIIGSAVPTSQPLNLEAGTALKANYFAERREIGVFNIGDQGDITVDGQVYGMAHRDMLYIGRGSKQITLSSINASHPARFYIVSLPAHKEYPVTHTTQGQANRNKVATYLRVNRKQCRQSIAGRNGAAGNEGTA